MSDEYKIAIDGPELDQRLTYIAKPLNEMNISATQVTGVLSNTNIPDLDTSKITTGLFPIARGGLGVSSLPIDSFVIGNGTNAIKTMTSNDVKSLLGIQSILDQLTNIDNNLDILNSNNETNKEAIANIQNSITSILSQLVEVEHSLDTLQTLISNMSKAQSDIVALQQAVTSLSSSVGTNANNINTLQTQTKELDSEIKGYFTEDQISLIVSQLTTALGSSGLSQSDIDNILDAVNQSIANSGNITRDDITHIIISSINGLLDDDSLNVLVNDSLNNIAYEGYLDWTTFKNHTSTDLDRWQSVLNLSSEVDDIKAGIENKTLDRANSVNIESDTQASGYVVDNALGGVIEFTVVNALLLNLGSVSINGTQEWSSAGLDIGIKTISGSLNVTNNDVITTTGISTINFIPYINS